MCGMLVAHLDGRERAFLLANPNSLKAKLATQAGPLVTSTLRRKRDYDNVRSSKKTSIKQEGRKM